MSNPQLLPKNMLTNLAITLMLDEHKRQYLKSLEDVRLKKDVDSLKADLKDLGADRDNILADRNKLFGELRSSDIAREDLRRNRDNLLDELDDAAAEVKHLRTLLASANAECNKWKVCAEQRLDIIATKDAEAESLQRQQYCERDVRTAETVRLAVDNRKLHERNDALQSALVTQTEELQALRNHSTVRVKIDARPQKCRICDAALTFLIHCHSSPAPFPGLRFPYYAELVKQWLSEDVITPGHERDQYLLTAKGRTWLRAIQAVPCPEAGT